MTGNPNKIHRFHEVTQIRDLIRSLDWDVQYIQTSSGPLNAEAFEIRLGNCLVFRERYDCHLIAHGTSTPRGFGLMVVERGLARFFGEEISPKKIVLFPPGSAIDVTCEPGTRSVIFVLPSNRVEDVAQDWNVELLQAPRVLVVEPGVDRLQHLLAILGWVKEILNHGDLSAWDAAEEDLVATFVGLFDRNTFPGGRNPGHRLPAAIRHAIAVRDHVCESRPDQLDLPALAQRLGVGRHHLNRCFRRHYGVAVHSFVQVCRLHQARALLTMPSEDLRVTDAAYACGFSHLGRFSTEYRALFGEMPSQTLRNGSQPGA